MSEEGNTGLIWEHRLALRLPGPLLMGAFLIAGCLSAVYLGFQWFFDLRIEDSPFAQVLFITCALMAPRYLLASRDRQQDGLQVSRSDRHEQEVQALQLPLDAIRRSRFAGAAGVLMVVGMWELLMVSLGRDLLTPWIRLQGNSAEVILTLLLGWVIGRNIYPAAAGFYDTPGPQRSDIDLLNLQNVYVYGRGGLRSALIWFIVVAIGGLLILPGLGSGLWVVLPGFAFQFGVGFLILLTPAREVRSLIRTVKREELARLEPLLRQARDDALTGDASTQGRLTDLLAYKTQVESTREWSFDSSTLVRFGLYLLIPVASMVGGALVERVVDMLLD